MAEQCDPCMRVQKNLEAAKPQLQKQQQEKEAEGAQARAARLRHRPFRACCMSRPACSFECSQSGRSLLLSYPVLGCCSPWYGAERPRWLGPLPHEYPPWLEGEAPGDYGFDIATLSAQEGKFDRYFELEVRTLHVCCFMKFCRHEQCCDAFGSRSTFVMLLTCRRSSCTLAGRCSERWELFCQVSLDKQGSCCSRKPHLASPGALIQGCERGMVPSAQRCCSTLASPSFWSQCGGASGGQRPPERI